MLWFYLGLGCFWLRFLFHLIPFPAFPWHFWWYFLCQKTIVINWLTNWNNCGFVVQSTEKLNGDNYWPCPWTVNIVNGICYHKIMKYLEQFPWTMKLGLYGYSRKSGQISKWYPLYSPTAVGTPISGEMAITKILY